MEQGHYVLQKDVTNPKPDRRSTRFHKQQLWTKGLRLYLIPPESHVKGKIFFGDLSHVHFGDRDEPGNELALNLKRAEFAIGQMFEEDSQAMGDVLALAYEKGLLELETVRNLMDEIKGMDEMQYLTFQSKHWL